MATATPYTSLVFFPTLLTSKTPTPWNKRRNISEEKVLTRFGCTIFSCETGKFEYRRFIIGTSHAKATTVELDNTWHQAQHFGRPIIDSIAGFFKQKRYLVGKMPMVIISNKTDLQEIIKKSFRRYNTEFSDFVTAIMKQSLDIRDCLEELRNRFPSLKEIDISACRKNCKRPSCCKEGNFALLNDIVKRLEGSGIAEDVGGVDPRKKGATAPNSAAQKEILLPAPQGSMRRAQSEINVYPGNRGSILKKAVQLPLKLGDAIHDVTKASTKHNKSGGGNWNFHGGSNSPILSDIADVDMEEDVSDDQGLLITSKMPNDFGSTVSLLEEGVHVGGRKRKGQLSDSASYLSQTGSKKSLYEGTCLGIPMYPKGKGIVKIFSQDRDRPGNQQDLKRLQDTFIFTQNIRCKVETFENFSREDIVAELNEARDSKAYQRNDSRYIVVIILAHGGNGKVTITDKDGMDVIYDGEYILDKNNDLVPLKFFEEFLTEGLEYFRGMPKILLVQACRGQKRNRLVSLQTDDNEKLEVAAPSNSETQKVLVPKLGDYLIVYSTLPEHVAYRDDNGGTFFIQEFCRQLQKAPHENFELIILKVANKLAQKQVDEFLSGNLTTQVIMKVSTFTKQFVCIEE